MLLLHTCCAPCSAAVIEWLLNRDIRPTLFYFNPNIFPLKEYETRKTESIRYATKLGLEIIDGEYQHNVWLREVSGMEKEAERGTRCLICFKIRLLESARIAHERGFKQIATTLASSRWKNIEQITQAGEWAVSQYEGVTFLNKNWRKEGLSERRNILLAENGFYNQRYCGCEFSIENKRNYLS